jgi:hypothetical protein
MLNSRVVNEVEADRLRWKVLSPKRRNHRPQVVGAYGLDSTDELDGQRNIFDRVVLSPKLIQRALHSRLAGPQIGAGGVLLTDEHLTDFQRKLLPVLGDDEVGALAVRVAQIPLLAEAPCGLVGVGALALLLCRARHACGYLNRSSPERGGRTRALTSGAERTLFVLMGIENRRGVFARLARNGAVRARAPGRPKLAFKPRVRLSPRTRHGDVGVHARARLLLSSLGSRLRCPRCGNYRMVVMFEPPTQSAASERRPLR